MIRTGDNRTIWDFTAAQDAGVAVRLVHIVLYHLSDWHVAQILKCFKKLSKEGNLKRSFPNLTASHVSKDSWSFISFLWAREE